MGPEDFTRIVSHPFLVSDEQLAEVHAYLDTIVTRIPDEDPIPYEIVEKTETAE